MSLEEIKNEYALESNLNCWVEFVNKTHKRYLDHAYKEIAERYAQQRVNEVLDKAADNFEKEIAVKSDYFNHRVGMFNAVKESILKLKNK